MTKKVSTLLTAFETTDPPAAVDFVVDGDHAFLALNVFTLTGTAPTISATATELIDKGFTLDYSGQTVNYTKGRTVRGSESNATAVIMDDTDGGATGTLELKKVHGNFIAGELLVEENQATPGSATVAGTLTRVVVEGPNIWCATLVGAVDAIAPFLVPIPAYMAAGEGDRTVVTPRRFRLKIVEGGTWTAAEFSVDLIQSGEL